MVNYLEMVDYKLFSADSHVQPAAGPLVGAHRTGIRVPGAAGRVQDEGRQTARILDLRRLPPTPGLGGSRLGSQGGQQVRVHRERQGLQRRTQGRLGPGGARWKTRTWTAWRRRSCTPRCAFGSSG